jgi:hypothetical protein
MQQQQQKRSLITHNKLIVYGNNVVFDVQMRAFISSRLNPNQVEIFQLSEQMRNVKIIRRKKKERKN